MSEKQQATDQDLELYKLAVEMADRISARRASLTTLPFTANTALFAILSPRSAERIFWLRTGGKRNPYDEDYEAMQPLASIAAKHNVAVVVLHHLNQQSEVLVKPGLGVFEAFGVGV